LPSEVLFQYRFEDEESDQVYSEPMQFVDQRMVYHREDVNPHKPCSVF